MRFKQGVRMQGTRPELILALIVADGVYREVGVNMTITSLSDSTHSLTSLHYSGCAADLRIRDLPEGVDPAKIASEIESRLTRDYDVVLEEDSHIHLEYQPRRPQ